MYNEIHCCSCLQCDPDFHVDRSSSQSLFLWQQPGQPMNNGASYAQTGYAQNHQNGAYSQQQPGVQPAYDVSYGVPVHATPAPAYAATDPSSNNGWQKVTAEDGRVYEFNPATNETRWPDMQPNAAPPTTDPNWHQAQDPEGNVYEYNTVTSETRWPNGPPLNKV